MRKETSGQLPQPAASAGCQEEGARGSGGLRTPLQRTLLKHKPQPRTSGEQGSFWLERASTRRVMESILEEAEGEATGREPG